MDLLDSFLISNGISYEKNTDLKKKTWIKTGGIVSRWIQPKMLDELIETVRFLQKNNLDYEIVGFTSNIYYLDSYNPSIIISTKSLKSYNDGVEFISCECGTPVASIARYAVSRGYKGFAGLVNLPGTVAAAIYNNSSCFGCSVSSLLQEVKILDSWGGISSLHPEDFSFKHRFSKFKSGELKGVILSVKLKKVLGSIDKEVEYARNASIQRKKTQGSYSLTLGSVYSKFLKRNNFKNLFIRFAGVFYRFKILSMKQLILIQLYLYGYKDLVNCVSMNNLNTFIWNKNEVDIYQKFIRYQQFMNKEFDNPVLEIEIRG